MKKVQSFKSIHSDTTIKAVRCDLSSENPDLSIPIIEFLGQLRIDAIITQCYIDNEDDSKSFLEFQFREAQPMLPASHDARSDGRVRLYHGQYFGAFDTEVFQHRLFIPEMSGRAWVPYTPITHEPVPEPEMWDFIKV
jgi:hypothetical protein